MAIVTRSSREIPLSEYPTGDGKPMAETFTRGEIMFGVRQILRDRFAEDPMAYVCGNSMMYYVKNNKRRHVSPDVFFVRGIPNTERECYFVWVEGKGARTRFSRSPQRRPARSIPVRIGCCIRTSSRCRNTFCSTHTKSSFPRRFRAIDFKTASTPPSSRTTGG